MFKTDLRIITLIFILYVSLILGFFFNEDLNYGAFRDWVTANLSIINNFSDNFLETFLTYDQYSRHSPIYNIFLSLFLRFDFSLDLARFIHLHLSITLIFIFYKCLEIKFKDTHKIYLIILSLIIFLSPTFRSLSIWPDSRLPGLLFFSATIYFFLKFEKTNSEKYIWLTSIFLIIASYISPNFSVFFIYFFYYFLKSMKLSKIFLLLIFNFLASLPILYYIFVMDINFIASGKTPMSNNSSVGPNFNLSNKIIIISTIILFHLSPVLLSKQHFLQFIYFFKKKFFFIFLINLFLIYFFDYQTSFTGGGVFFHFSNYIFNNNYFFFVVSFLSLSFLGYLSSLSLNNFFILLILILSNIQNTIYHKYYEPLILILFFTIFKNADLNSFLSNKQNLINIYILSLVYILMRVFKNTYLV